MDGVPDDSHAIEVLPVFGNRVLEERVNNNIATKNLSDAPQEIGER